MQLKLQQASFKMILSVHEIISFGNEFYTLTTRFEK